MKTKGMRPGANLILMVTLIVVVLELVSCAAQPADQVGGAFPPPIKQSNSAAITAQALPPVVVATNYVTFTNFTTVTNYQSVPAIMPPAPNPSVAGGAPQTTTNSQYDWLIKWFSIGTAVSAFCASFALFFTYKTFKNTQKQGQLNSSRDARKVLDAMLFDTDKILIATPSLWTVYDTVFETDKSFIGADVLRRRVCLYLYFNKFAAAYNHYHRDQALISDEQKGYEAEFLESWDNYIRQFFHCSSDARQLWSLPATKSIYTAKFVEYINGFIDEVTPHVFSPDKIPDLTAIVKDIREDRQEGLYATLKSRFSQRHVTELKSINEDTWSNDATQKQNLTDALTQILNGMIVSNVLDSLLLPKELGLAQTKLAAAMDEAAKSKTEDAKRKVLETRKEIWTLRRDFIDQQLKTRAATPVNRIRLV